MYRYCFYDLLVHFWWPNKSLFSYNQRWNTLYKDTWDVNQNENRLDKLNQIKDVYKACIGK